MKLLTKKNIIRFLGMLLPLTALIVLGVSLYFGYSIIYRPPKEEYVECKHISPELFSSRIHDNLTTVLTEYGISHESIKSVKGDSTIIGNHYTVKIPENMSLYLLNLELSLMVHHFGGIVLEGIEDTDEKTLTLTLGVDTTATDVIILNKTRKDIIQTAVIAFIIDDLGLRNPENIRRFCESNYHVTLAILPYKPYTSDTINLARTTNTPYILHMPMEPKSKSMDTGSETIRVGDSQILIEKKLSRAFKNVRGVKGMNNHMGSKATEDVYTMECVMKYLKANNLFFIDSQTSNETKGYAISRRFGLKGAMMNGYVDAVNDSNVIKKKLDELADKALQKGSLIIIGHDRPMTLEILSRKLNEIESRGITFVPVSELID